MLVRESRVDDIIWNAYMPRFRENRMAHGYVCEAVKGCFSHCQCGQE